VLPGAFRREIGGPAPIKTGIEPFGRLVEQVMPGEPYTGGRCLIPLGVVEAACQPGPCIEVSAPAGT
jgi:hypothetical protein